MRTKTNFNAIQELMAKYTPQTRGIVSGQEIAMIHDILELKTRDLFELNDVRDMAVALYGQSANTAEKEQGLQAMMALMDAMSAVTAVIDSEKARRVAPDDEKALLAMCRAHSKPVRYAVMDEDGRFMTTDSKNPFSDDPSKARGWAKAADADVMAGYARNQFKKSMSVAGIRTGHVVYSVPNPAREDAAAAGAGGGSDD